MNGNILFFGLLLTVVVLYSGCGILGSCTAAFTAHTEPISYPASKSTHLNGAYITEWGSGESFVFYPNGHVKWLVSEYDFLKNPSTETWQSSVLRQPEYKEHWGNYWIKGDSISIQVFNHHNQDLCKRWTQSYHGILVNDSTIRIHAWYSISFLPSEKEENLLQEPYELHLLPGLEKPNPSQAWFHNKRWYRKELHESRKPPVAP